MTIVATCIPTISSELHSTDKEAWIGTAYLWSSVTFTPLYGRLSDILGRKQAYLQAAYLFTIGTFLCGLAPTLPLLALARFLAGMGGGGIGTVANVILSDIFSPEERGFYQGLSFAMMGLGMGLGGPLGGFLTQHFGWRAAFYAQIPLTSIVLVLAHTAVPNSGFKPTWASLKEVDFGGAFSLLVSIGALLQFLNRSTNLPLSKDTFGLSMLAIFTTFLLFFIYVELKIAKKPVLPLVLLKRRTPLCVGIIASITAVVNFNMIYHLPEFFEIVMQTKVSVAGAHLLPNSVAMALSAPAVGYYSKRQKRYKWITVACCTGPVIAMALLSSLNERSSVVVQWLSVVPMGAGFSGLLTATMIAMLNTVEAHEIAIATGFTFMFRSLGQVTGVSLSTAVFQTVLNRELHHTFEDEGIIDQLRHASHAITTLPHAWQREAARRSFAVALRWTFLFGLIGALLLLLTSFFIPNLELRSKPNHQNKQGVFKPKDDEAVSSEETI